MIQYQDDSLSNLTLDDTQIEQVHDLHSDEKLRQIVMQNDKISLSDIAPEGGNVLVSKGGVLISILLNFPQ